MVVYKKGDKIGDYRVIKVLGGGMGRVYICNDEIKQHLYALKTFREEFFSSEDINSSFLKEVLTWVNLGDHPNIVRCYTPFTYAGQLFVIIEYITPHSRWGNTLTDYFRMDLTLQKSLLLAIQFCHGMEHAISRGIVCHRDIKPDNIMITDVGTLKITDFGLVKVFDEIKDFKKFRKFTSKKSDQGLSFLDVTEDKIVVGTPPWMAPEQFEGRTDIRSDIYSFGVVLYQMINKGMLPFLAQTVKGYYYAHKTAGLPKCESKLVPVIKKCMQKNPKKRYQTFKDLLKDLEKIYNHEFDEWTYDIKPREEQKLIQHVNKGVALLSGGMYDKAIVELEKALEIDPNVPQIYLNLGSAYNNKKQFDKSIDYYNKALQIKPDYDTAMFNLGNLFRDKGDLERAIKEYKRALAINPKRFNAHVHLAGVLKEKGLFQEAVNEFVEALKINPNFTQIYYSLGYYYLLLEQVDKARESYHKFVTNPPSGMHEKVKTAVEMLKSTENKDDAKKIIKDLQSQIKK